MRRVVGFNHHLASCFKDAFLILLSADYMCLSWFHYQWNGIRRLWLSTNWVTCPTAKEGLAIGSSYGDSHMSLWRMGSICIVKNYDSFGYINFFRVITSNHRRSLLDTGGLLKTVHSLVKTTHLTILAWVDKSPRLLHENLFLKVAVEECGLNVHLDYLKVISSNTRGSIRFHDTPDVEISLKKQSNYISTLSVVFSNES